MSDALFKIVNPEFDFQFGDKTYRVRQATLEKFVQYQQRVKQLSDEGAEDRDLRMVAFCVSLMLRDQDPSLTEDEVMKYIPVSVDVSGLLIALGFINPKMAAALATQENQTTTPTSQG